MASVARVGRSWDDDRIRYTFERDETITAVPAATDHHQPFS